MNRNRLLPFAILQILPVVILPPSMIFTQSGINLGSVFLLFSMLAIFALLGWGLLQGKRWALTMSIFMQGMNLIVRVMMLFPNAVSRDGIWDITLIVLFLISISLSGWLLVRLDRPDIHSLIVS